MMNRRTLLGRLFGVVGLGSIYHVPDNDMLWGPKEHSDGSKYGVCLSYRSGIGDEAWVSRKLEGRVYYQGSPFWHCEKCQHEGKLAPKAWHSCAHEWDSRLPCLVEDGVGPYQHT